MVACHDKLGVFFLNDEIVERFLLWELIAQTHTIIIYAEANDDVTVGRSLIQVYLHFVIIVANGSSLTPYRLPCLIKRRGLASCFGESVHQIGFRHTLAGMLVLGKLQSEVRGFTYCLALITHLVGRLSITSQRECYRYIAIGRFNGLRCRQEWQQQTNY